MKRKLSDVMKLLKQFFGVDEDWKYYRVSPKTVSVKADFRKRMK
jgi:hypothetical protein